MRLFLRSSILVGALGILAPANPGAQEHKPPRPMPEERMPNPDRLGANDIGANQPLIELRLTPDVIFVDDEVTLHWNVRDPRAVAWSGPVSLHTTVGHIRDLPNPAPASGSFTFTAQRTFHRESFSLEAGTALSPQTRTVDYRVLERPSITSMTTGIELGGFRDDVSGHPGDLLGVLGRGFGDQWPDDRVMMSINGREFPLEIRDWSDTRIGARIPHDPPVVDWSIFGRGSVYVVKAPRGRSPIVSNSLGVEVVRRPPSEPIPMLTFGAPRVVRPLSSERSPRDLSDHWGLAVDVTYRPHGRVVGDAEHRRLDRPEPVVFTLFTYNIAQLHIGYQGDRSQAANLDDIARHLNEARYGIVCLQEAFDENERERLIRLVANNYGEYREGARGGGVEGHSGLLILTRFAIIDTHRETFPEGTLDILDLRFDHWVAKGVLGTRIRLTSDPSDTIDVYTTHTDSVSRQLRADQFTIINTFIGEHSPQGNWILAGDLNVKGDQQSPSAADDSEYSQMMTLLGTPRDLWTASYFLEGNPGYTDHPRANGFIADNGGGAKRLDYILVGRPATSPPPPVRSESSTGIPPPPPSGLR
jgi:endonuclease/exonuclease/phosphatase family metal-dependent hydrolase